MEELKKRLEFPNTVIQVQAVGRLVEQVLAKHQQPFSASTCSSQSVELGLVWQTCGHEDPALCSSVCDAVVTLVQQGKADYGYVLNALLNLIPTAKNLSGIVQAVTDLLVHELLCLTQDQQPYTCPYTIRNPPHPLITIVTSRPDSWPLLQQQLQRLLGWKVKRVQDNLVTLLAPFLKFVILEPHQSAQFTQLRMSTTSVLLQGAAAETQQNIVTFLLKITPCLQVQTMAQCGETTTLLQTLLWHLRLQVEGQTFKVSSAGSSAGSSVSPSAPRLASLCEHCLALASSALHNHSHSPGALLGTLLETAQQHPQSLAIDATVTHLVALLWHASSTVTATVLRLATVCLNHSQRWSSIHAGMLFLPCLHITAMSDPVAMKANKSTNQMLALQLMKVLETYIVEQRDQKKSGDNDHVKNWKTLSISSQGYTYQLYASLAEVFQKNDSSVCDWLEGIQSAVSSADHVPCHLTCLVASLLVVQKEAACTNLCLKVLTSIAEKEVAQSANMLPLLLYKLGKEDQPDIKQNILQTIPKVATHKVTVAPTLRCLQFLGSKPSLRAVAMRLVTSLWQQQDRCFPQLQQMLLESGRGSVSMATKLDDVLVAKAACMRDVCKLRPEQHGEDLLAPLSSILNECTSETEAVAAALALEGLAYLCQDEVIDIGTAWTVLAAKLGKDNRPLVMSRICHLLSLVPSLEVSSKQYEEFSSDATKRLWTYSQNADSLVSGSAYRALAQFSPSAFNIYHLPSQVTADAREAAAAAEAEEDGAPILPPVPGMCYTRLLRLLPDAVLEDYQTLMTSLSRQEVGNLPRGVYHSAGRRHASSATQDKALAAVPEFLQAEYETNKQPGLRAGLAAGMLFTYDPQMTLGRDGKPRRTNIIQHGRNYQQTLYTLLQEVSVQPTDWRMCMVLPSAWLSFLDRCFLAHLEMRKNELALQLEKGEVTDPEENKLHQEAAWLWSRDKLTDMIKNASRGSPTVQGNSMHALAGLAAVSTYYASGMDSDTQKRQSEALPEHLSQAHWLTIVADTLLAVVDVNYKPQGRTFSLCQQRGSGHKTAASILAQSCAATALSLIAPVLISGNADAIYASLDLLSKGLPDRQPDISAVLHLHSGLGLGLLLAQLFREHFADVTGTQGMVAVWKAMDQLEKTSFTASQDREGSILGLAVCLSAMCTDSKTDTRVRVRSVYEQLSVAMEMTDTSDCAHEPLSICLAYLATSAYSANILGQDTVDRLVAQLYQLHCQHTQSTGLSLSLGCMCHGLWKADHPTVGDLVPKLFATWVAGLQDTSTPTLQMLSYLAGAMAIAGSEACFVLVETQSSTASVAMSELVKVVTKLVRSSSNLAIQSRAAWLLAHLHMAAASAGHSSASVPLSYQYLPETSILRALTDLSIEAGKLGPEVIRAEWLQVALCSLIEGASIQSLPPVNWGGILSPIMRMDYGESIQSLCVKLAACQSTSSPSAAMFLASWMVAPLYNSLNDSSKLVLQEYLPVLIKSVSSSKLTEYFKHGFEQLFLSTTRWSDCCHALGGLQRALQVHDPPQTVTLLLYQLVEMIYGLVLKNCDVRQRGVWYAMCQCLAELPDEVIDKVTSNDLEDDHHLAKALYVRCNLVSVGCQPLAWLNRAVEAVMFSEDRSDDLVLQLLMQCFSGCARSSAESCRVTHRQQWLLELMGHIKNMAAGRVQVEGADMPLDKVIELLILVFCAAVASWSNMACSLLLGLPSFERDKTYMAPRSAGQGHLEGHLGHWLRLLMPESLCILLSVEPWKQSSFKMIDWLMSVLNIPCVQKSDTLSSLLRECLFSLRETTEFKKVNTWSRAYNLL